MPSVMSRAADGVGGRDGVMTSWTDAAKHCYIG